MGNGISCGGDSNGRGTPRVSHGPAGGATLVTFGMATDAYSNLMILIYTRASEERMYNHGWLMMIATLVVAIRSASRGSMVRRAWLAGYLAAGWCLPSS